MPKAFSCPIGQSNLISTLSASDRALVEPHLRPVKMHIGMTLEAPETPIELVYFPKSGVGSTVTFSNNGRRIETGLFGYEGMSGTAAILQTGYTSNETFMQVAGEGLVIEPDRLQDLMEQSPSFQRHQRFKLRSYGAAKREVAPGIDHWSHKRFNNRAENSHLPIRNESG